MGVCTKYCDPCIYRKVFTGGWLPYCDYLCMVGTRRPCPAGDGCTVRVTRRVYRKRERNREAKRRSYQKHREELLARQKQYQKEHREQLNAYYREYRKRRKDSDDQRRSNTDS